jgi:tetratricopeptide (TPR) repeat protein
MSHPELREDDLKKLVFVLLFLSISVAAYANRPSPGVQPLTPRDIPALSPPSVGTPEIPTAGTVDHQEDDLKIGMQNYRERKYAEAITALSRYASLAPRSQQQQRTAALLIIGKSLEETNRPWSALNIYSRVTELHPNSPEALLGIVAMADIGIDHPELNRRSGKKWAEYVRDPVTAYDFVLSNNIPLPIVEHIHHQRGRALWKSKRYEEARQTLTLLIKKFPQTGYREQARGIISDCMTTLIDQHSQSGDHLAVANLFHQGWKEGLIRATDIDTLLKCSFSLFSLGLHEESSALLKTIRRNAPGSPASNISRIDKMVAEMEGTRSPESSDSTTAAAKWRQFQTGREQLGANQPTLAEKTLADLKSGEDVPFWSKVTDYLLEENRWVRKYKRQIKP